MVSELPVVAAAPLGCWGGVEFAAGVAAFCVKLSCPDRNGMGVVVDAVELVLLVVMGVVVAGGVGGGVTVVDAAGMGGVTGV